LRARALLGNELRGHAGTAHQLCPAARVQLDVVNLGAKRDVADWQSVSRPDVGGGAGFQRIAHLDAQRRDDVALLAVLVFEQGDARAAVGVVLDRGNARGRAPPFALEVDDAVAPFVAAAAVAHSDAALVVAPSLPGQRHGQRALRLGAGDRLKGRNAHVTAPRRRGAVYFDRHKDLSPFAERERDLENCVRHPLLTVTHPRRTGCCRHRPE